MNGIGLNSDLLILARALGLARIAPADRQDVNPGQVLAGIEAIKQRVVAFETAQLDQSLANVSADIRSLPFESLRGHQDIILSRLPRIVDAIERGVEVGGKGYSNAQQLLRLVEQLPPDALEPYWARIRSPEKGNRDFAFRRDGS